MHRDTVLMLKEQSSHVTQTFKSAVGGSTSVITPKLEASLRSRSFSTFTMGKNQLSFRFSEPYTKRIAVVSTVGNQQNKTVFWTGKLDKQTFEELDFRLGRACGRTCQRYPLAISYHNPHGSLSSLCFPNVESPFFSGSKTSVHPGFPWVMVQLLGKGTPNARQRTLPVHPWTPVPLERLRGEARYAVSRDPRPGRTPSWNQVLLP